MINLQIFIISKNTKFLQTVNIITEKVLTYFLIGAPLQNGKKQLPKKKWQKLENLIKKKYKKIVWQNPDDNLEKYISKYRGQSS